MTAYTLPMDGGCRCGQVRLRISDAPMLTSVCHCTGCQRMTGSAYSLTITVPDSGFVVSDGAPVIGGIHGEIEHYHCPQCMSWVFTRPPKNTPMDFVNVRATMLDDATWVIPFIECYTCEKLPWAQTPANHSYEKFPPMEEYGMLMAEFAERNRS